MNDSQNQTGTSGPKQGQSGIVVEVFGRTDVGLVREHNEDNFLVADLTRAERSIKPEVRNHTVGTKGSLFLVCDGMGGAAAGEVASQIAVDTIYEMMQGVDEPGDDKELARRLDAAITEAGRRIYTAAKADRHQRGMGTTVTAAVLTGPRLIIGQIGDSRAYILRHGELYQVTKDQSLVQQLIDAKQLSEEEARNFERSNIILQALGTSQDVHVDMTSVVLRANDVLVMCSDGLSGLVEPEQIVQVATEIQEPLEACRKLTDMACEAGGHDNITVIIARFTGDELLEPDADELPTYIKFHHALLTETTVRSPIPNKPDADERRAQEEQEVGAEDIRARPRSPQTAKDTPRHGIKLPGQSGQRSSSRVGIFASAAAVVMIVALVAGYIMSQDQGAGPEPGDPEIKVVVPPSNPVPNAAVSETPPVQSGPPEPQEQPEEPRLGPISPDKITKKEPSQETEPPEVKEPLQEKEPQQAESSEDAAVATAEKKGAVDEPGEGDRKSLKKRQKKPGDRDEKIPITKPEEKDPTKPVELEDNPF